MFIIASFISAGCYGALIFTNWMSSAKQTMEKIAADVNADIYSQVTSFIQGPYQVNELNRKILENGMLDLADERQRDRFFVGVLEAHNKNIYSFSYGTATGAYYGARRNQDGSIEIMRNDAKTGGNPWYYSVNEDLTAGDLVVQAGQFDPRNRDWYTSAVEAEGQVFSPLYKHFVVDDLTVSIAGPIFNETGELQGVLGTHILLSDIGSYLKNAVHKHNGIALIIEKESNYLVANSMGAANFTVLQDGTLERYLPEDIQNIGIQSAYENYQTNGEPQQIYRDENGSFFGNIREMQMNGIDWIVLSAIPEANFMTDVRNSMRWTAIIAILFLLLSALIYNLFMNKYMQPIKSLLQVSDEFSSGNLSKRVDVARNDEIGHISKSFNNVADKMQALIDNLETVVWERTEELQEANLTLDAKKDELQLILDSAAEAIHGVDLEGKCTFCNRSCIEMLGYSDKSELLGKNMHWQIHHTHRDGSPFLMEDCKIFTAFIKGEGTHVEDEVFWRADGTSFDVEYFSYPQVRNGEIIGAVVTFMDVSERKQKEAEIRYLNYYDTLTGLYNRRYFEENRDKLDLPENLPLSVIFADINGLKMTNDIFGHAAGDKLIKKSAEILQQACRQNDLIARVGGDEFVILLPNTTGENAKKILDRIKSGFADAHVEAIKCSIALGLDTKRSPEQLLDEIMANAENAMYRDKTMNRTSTNRDMIDTIVNTLHTRYPREKQHSMNVGELCAKVATALELHENEISKIARAGYMHDIGKVVLDEGILTKDSLFDEEREEMKQHTAVGYRILSLFDDTLDLAEYVYGHHERWDGSGYPRGLKGEQIPLGSRIISVVEVHDRVLNRGEGSLVERKQASLDVIKSGAGSQFDPQVVELFLQVLDAIKSGE